jgi:hypothetical protein
VKCAAVAAGTFIIPPICILMAAKQAEGKCKVVPQLLQGGHCPPDWLNLTNMLCNIVDVAKMAAAQSGAGLGRDTGGGEPGGGGHRAQNELSSSLPSHAHRTGHRVNPRIGTSSSLSTRRPRSYQKKMLGSPYRMCPCAEDKTRINQVPRVWPISVAVTFRRMAETEEHQVEEQPMEKQAKAVGELTTEHLPAACVADIMAILLVTLGYST